MEARRTALAEDTDWELTSERVDWEQGFEFGWLGCLQDLSVKRARELSEKP